MTKIVEKHGTTYIFDEQYFMHENDDNRGEALVAKGNHHDIMRYIEDGAKGNQTYIEDSKMSPKAQRMLLERGNAKEILFYLEKYQLHWINHVKLVERGKMEEMLAMRTSFCDDAVLMIIRRGYHEVIMDFLAVEERKLSSDLQVELVKRGNHEEIMRYEQTHFGHRHFWQAAQVEIVKRGNLKEMMTVCSGRISVFGPDLEVVKALIEYDRHEVLMVVATAHNLSAEASVLLVERGNHEEIMELVTKGYHKGIAKKLVERANHEEIMAHLANCSWCHHNEALEALVERGNHDEIMAWIAQGHEALAGGAWPIFKRGNFSEIEEYAKKQHIYSVALRLIEEGDHEKIMFCISVGRCFQPNAEKALIDRGNAKEIMAYVENHGLWSGASQSLLLERGVHEEIMAMIDKADKGHSVITENVQLELIERGKTEEIKAYIAKCRFSSAALIKLIERGVHEEIMCYISTYGIEKGMDKLMFRGNRDEVMLALEKQFVGIGNIINA